MITMKPILLEIPERFETQRLIISLYENGDGEEFYQILQSNVDYLQEELNEVGELKSIEDAEKYVRCKKVTWLSRKRLVSKIFEKSTGKMIGQLCAKYDLLRQDVTRREKSSLVPGLRKFRDDYQ